jgi:fucose permease
MWLYPPAQINASLDVVHFFLGVGSLIAPLVLSAFLQYKHEEADLAFYALTGVCGLLMWFPLASRSPTPQTLTKILEHPNLVGNKPIFTTEHTHPARNEPEAVNLSATELDQSHSNNSEGKERGGIDTTLTRTETIIFMFGISSFLFMTIGAEVAGGTWIPTYVLQKFQLTDVVASYVTSVYWSGVAIGRLLTIPMTKHVSPTTMLWVSLFCGMGSCIILAVAQPVAWLWIGWGLCGLSISCLYPCIMSLAPLLGLPTSGHATGWYVLGVSLGQMAIPYAVGESIALSGTEAMIYVLSGTFVVASLILATMSFAQSHMKRKRGL